MAQGLDTLIKTLIDNPLHGWSVGTFGAIGEFMRDEGETVRRDDGGKVQTIVSDRGGLRVTAGEALRPIAYDTLGSDGETWGQSVAFCLPIPAEGLKSTGVVERLGPDADAIREQDRASILYDMGVGLGLVRMCARTADAELVAALDALQGKSILGPDAGEAMRLVVKTSPHRVLLSPVARLEVYSLIPGPGGESPAGPHTHLLPRMLSAKRTHAANAPIPEGLQPVLTLHPRTPWRDAMGKRTPFNEALDRACEELLDSYALPEDRVVRANVEAAVRGGAEPSAYHWPDTRRGRTAARITLRRLAQKDGPQAVAAWRSVYDRTAEDEADEDAAQHA